MFSSPIYKSSPVWLQELMVSTRAYGRLTMREGERFRRFLAEADRTQWLEAAELRRDQEVHVRALLECAATQVPLYRELYGASASLGVGGSAIDALHTLPVIDKDVLRKAGGRAMRERRSWPLFEGGTSGTTGPPLKLKQDLSAINRENAFVFRQLRWAGYETGQPRAWIRGDMIVPADDTTPPFWRRNSAENMLVLSSYHLSVTTAQGYLDALARFDPQIIQAYPSSIGFLASYLHSKNLDYGGRRLRGVVTSSETVDDETRRLVKQRFGCPIFDWYGQFERVAAIGTCEHSTLHVIEDYSYVELMPNGEGECEIVGSGFNNLVMPLVRYRTGDLVEPAAEGTTCRCGRNFRIVKCVMGRDEDVIKLPDGRMIGRLDHIFKGLDSVLDAQIRQDEPRSVMILIVPGEGFGNHTVESIRANAAERLGSGIRIDVESVASLPRTKSGKFRRVICNV
jgi:phenylacetate-CoA ligase